MTDHAPTATDWRAAITALCGGDTIEMMLAWATRRPNGPGRIGWPINVEWRPHWAAFVGSVVCSGRPGMTFDAEHPTDPAEALASALLAAVEMGEGRT